MRLFLFMRLFKNKIKSTIPKTIYALHPTEILTKRLHSIKVKLLNLHILRFSFTFSNEKKKKPDREREKFISLFLQLRHRFYRSFMNAFEYYMQV